MKALIWIIVIIIIIVVIWFWVGGSGDTGAPADDTSGEAMEEGEVEGAMMEGEAAHGEGEAMMDDGSEATE